MNVVFQISKREVDAIAVAYDELVSYLDVVGNEGQLDDEEMPTEKLTWASATLRGVLDRFARFEHLAEKQSVVVPVDPVRFTVQPTPPSGREPE